MFVILEYNQASGKPTPNDFVYDSVAAALEDAIRMRRAALQRGRGEHYAVAELSIVAEAS